jgi:hypothetical protein
VLNEWFKIMIQIFDSFGSYLSQLILQIGEKTGFSFSRNRGLCLPLLKFNIDVRYWIPKVMCGGIETYRHQTDETELWLISR